MFTSECSKVWRDFHYEVTRSICAMYQYIFYFFSSKAKVESVSGVLQFKF